MFNKLKKVSYKKLLLLTALAVCAIGQFAFADTTTIDIAGPLTTGLNTTVTNTLACFSAVIPIGLTIFGAKYAWIKGTAFFAKLAK